MEHLIEIGLTQAGIDFVTDFGGENPSNLDFKIIGPIGTGVEIEVKRFHSPRIAEQMARASDVIAIQGPVACAFFAYLLACRSVAAAPETAS
jgi:hypothetical protein